MDEWAGRFLAEDPFLRLVSLELHGFKSFADPQKLVFPWGLTAVVGPNGCGKSNISDAIAWVLGEQRATLLRGSEMADVIFAGTSARKPMGLAEVKLTVERPDPAQGGAPREVVLSRRLYRDQGSEYRVDGREVRLKDVQDLLLDTGLGTRAYSFIQQGQIDLILSTKPKDRRQLLEEAAGITRYKLRRGDAERRLGETRANLERLEDILHELGKQQESLKRQAARARKAQELDGGILEAQRILLAGRLLELQRAQELLAEQREGLERQVAELTAQNSDKASEVEGLRLRLEERTQGREAIARKLLDLERRLGLADQDRGFQEERRKEALASQEALIQRLLELEGRAAGIQSDTRTLEEALLRAQGAFEGALVLVQATEESAALAGGALRKVESELKDLRQRQGELHRQTLERQRTRHALHLQQAQAEGRLAALNDEEAERAPRLQSLQEEATRLGREGEAAQDRLAEMEEALAGQRALVRRADDELREVQRRRNDAESALEAAERRLDHLGDALRKAEGAGEVGLALAWLRGAGIEPALLAEALSVDEAVRPELERLLGGWIQAATLPPEALALLPELPGQLGVALLECADAPARPEGCEPLLAHIHWAGPARPLLGLLERAFRCPDEGILHLGMRHPDLAFVSPRCVKLPFAPLQVGVQSPAASPLKLAGELEAARREREARLEAVEALESEPRRRQGLLAEQQERLREMEEDARLARLQREDLDGRLRSVRSQLQAIADATARADAQWELLEAEISRIKGELRSLDAVPEAQVEEGLEGELKATEHCRQAAQSELDELRERLLEVSRMRDAAWAERDGVERQIQLQRRSAFEIQEARERLLSERAQAEGRAELATRRLDELEVEIQQALAERESLAQAHATALPEIARIQEEVRGLEVQARNLREALENARQLHQESLVQAAQVHGRLEALAKEVEISLSIPPMAFLASVSDAEREAWELGELVHQTRLSELQSKRLELGSVNPLAIQELSEAEERLDFMNRQRADVLEAIQNLEQTIQEINATSRERFREAFDFINARFQEVFREAFGGGSARLSLEDPKDLLECGIEITAQPPGKSPKALTLLSGGEKALTAISLLFAIFHFKPGPFCVLDEVDAPLDEANVTRFAAMVNRMKAETQFLVITHQKPTMIAADTLYGVTMEEQGISRLVSVQLREAEQLV